MRLSSARGVSLGILAICVLPRLHICLREQLVVFINMANGNVEVGQGVADEIGAVTMFWFRFGAHDRHRQFLVMCFLQTANTLMVKGGFGQFDIIHFVAVVVKVGIGGTATECISHKHIFDPVAR